MTMIEAADEFFLVWKGRFSVEFRDRRIDMQDGDCVLVPRGVEHRTSAEEDAKISVEAVQSSRRNVESARHRPLNGQDVKLRRRAFSPGIVMTMSTSSSWSGRGGSRWSSASGA